MCLSRHCELTCVTLDYLLFYIKLWQVLSQKSGFRDTCFNLRGLFLAGRIALVFSPNHCQHKLVTLLMKGIRSWCFLVKGEILPSQTLHHMELMNASHSTNLFTNSCDHISTNGKAPLHSHINHNTPQFLYSLWRRANIRNISFLNLSPW